MNKRIRRSLAAIMVVLLGSFLVASCQKQPAPAPTTPTAAQPAQPQQAVPAAAPAPKEPVGKAVISFLSGEVQAKTGDTWQDAEIGMQLPQSASVKTGADSLCELQLGSTAVVRVSENTTVSLASVTLEPKKSQVEIGMVVGTVVCKVNALTTGERFQVKTVNAVCGVRGTEFLVAITKQSELTLGVKKGEVAVLPPWADFQELRAHLGDKADVLDPLVAQVDESARVVKADQQLVVQESTARAWQKSLERYEQKVKALSDRAQKGEEITADAVQAVSKDLEPQQTVIAKALAAPTPLAAETSGTLAQTAVMRVMPAPAPVTAAQTQPAAPVSVKVTVTAQPSDAEILVNGALAGRGECTGLFMPGEKVTFVAQKAGYVTKTLDVTVEKGVSKSFSLELERGKENVNLRVTPSNAVIDLGGATVGTGSYSAQLAAGEKLSFTVHAEGYAAKTLDVQVAAGGSNSWQVTLEELKVGVSLRTVPSDAEILLNGKSVGRGAFAQGFKAGEQLSFLVRKDGYDDRAMQVTVARGAAQEYTVQLDARPIVRRLALAKKSMIGQVSVSGGSLYAADATGLVIASATGGQPLWSLVTKNAPNETSYPLIIGSRLYFSGASEFVVANAATGAVVFREQLDAASTHQFGQRVAVIGQVGVFPTTAGVKLFDPATGAAKQDVPITSGSMMTPAAWNGKIVTVSQEGVLYVLDSSGSVLGKVATKAIQPVAVAVSIVGDKGYFADRKGLVVAVDLANLKVLWQISLAKTSTGVFQDLECGPQGVYAYAKGALYALGLAQGETLFAPIAGVTCPPLYRDGKLYYGTEQNALSIADAATGKVLGSLDAKARITTRPLWLDGLLYVGTATGEVVEINPAAVK
jgi:outer membrane protein assembly factor BamB